ncbi:MAG: hypothetical protein ACE5FU_02140, partial [Nitrospinota bacterium]
MKYSFPSLKTASGENHNFTDPEMRPTRYFALTIGFLCATVTLIFGNACISWGAEKKIFIKVPKV